MRAVSYLRVSTEEQAASGLGIEAQRAAVATHVLAHGATLVAEIVDDGVSGSVPAAARPGLGRALTMLQSGDADTLVAAKLDRLGRSAYDVLGLADQAAAEGWQLVVLDLGLDTTTPVGHFTLSILAAVAELERNLIRQRTREALAAKKARGERVGRPAELSAETVGRVRALRAEGRTLREIVDMMNEERWPTARGGAWSLSTVRWILGGRAA